MGYDGNSTINIKTGANITAGAIFNTETLSGENNAYLKVESNATLNCSNAKIHSLECTNNGTLSATKIYGVVYFAQGSTTTLSDAEPLNATTTVSGDATLNLTASTSALNQPFIIDSEKTLSIYGSSTVNFTGAISGAGNIVLNYFPTAATHPTLTDWTGSIEFANGGNDSRGNLTDILNAWGNENSTIKLNGGKGYLSAGIEVKPTLNLTENTSLEIVNGFSGASTAAPIFKRMTGAGTFAITWKPAGKFSVTINELKNFTGTLQCTRPINVGKLVLFEGPTKNQKLIDLSCSESGSVTLTNLYINDEDVTEVYDWNGKTDETTSHICVIASAQAKFNDAIDLVRPYNEGNYLGTSIGKYTISLGSTTYTDYDSFYNTVVNMQKISDWEGKTVTVTINQPTTGYYRLKSKYNDAGSDYYLSCQNTNSNNNAQQTRSTDEKNIFYIEVGNENSTIKSYSTGYYFGDHTRANYTSVTDNPAKWTFSEGVNQGTYQLTSNVVEYTEQNLNGQILYGWSGASSKSYADRNSAVDNDGHTDWILIPVAKEDLPVIPAPGVTDVTKPVLLGNITSASDVTSNITASAKFVDLSQATIGTSIDNIKAAVNGINPNAIIIAPKGTSVASTTTNVLLTTDTENTYTCNNLQLNDDVIAQFTSETNFTNTKVTYSRTATASQWGTIYLPYDPEVEEGVTYYELTASDENSLTFTKVDNPEANTPYMYKKTTAGDMSVTNTSTSATFALGGDTSPHVGSGVNNYHLVGILTNSSIVESEGTEAKAGYNQIVDSNAYYFKNTDHKFYSLNQRFNMKAFRCYLTTTNNSARQDVLGFSYEENGEPTGVSFIESEDGNTVDVIFDLNGRRLQNAKKGINIINGKKVIK